MPILFNDDAENLNVRPIVGYRTGTTIVTEGMKIGVMLQFKMPDDSLHAFGFSADVAERMAAGLLQKAAIARELKPS